MELKQKHFWKILILGTLIALVVFIVLVVQLLKRGSVVYTDQETKQEFPSLIATDPVLGSSTPTVVLVNYSDFACSACRDVAQSARSVVEEFPEEVAVVFKDFPNTSLHPEAERAHVAARCANEQNAFWQYHDLLFANQNELSEELYFEIAFELDLRERKFTRCMNKSRGLDEVRANIDDANRLGLAGSPTLFVNTERFVGNMNTGDLRVLVSAIIQQLQ